VPVADGGRYFCEVKVGDESTGFMERRYDYSAGPFTLEVPFTGDGSHYIVLSWDMPIVPSSWGSHRVVTFSPKLLVRPMRPRIDLLGRRGREMTRAREVRQ